jgi:4'-phosphopantetheinyl transferase EntD
MLFAATPATLAGAAYTLAVASYNELLPRALTSRERREYDGLPHAARRRDWLAGRCAAKRAIGARWHVPADWIELASTPDAAPSASIRQRAGSWSLLPDRLTIAHRDGVALAAAFPSAASVGVDLERAGEVSPVELRYIMSDDERSRHGGIDPTLVWVLKEAAWKALGLAPTAALTSLQLVFRADTRELAAVRHDGRELRARAGLARFDVARPLIAALVEIAVEAS